MGDKDKVRQLEMNIDSLKAQLEMLTEQMERWSQYQMALVDGALYVYEINITRNAFIVKHPELYADLDLPYDCSYTDMIKKACETKVCEEDAGKVCTSVSPEALISVFTSGKRQMFIEYRREIKDTDVDWVRFTAYMMRNRDTNDICALIVINNVNSQRTQELNLIEKAQYDPLTKLYNRNSMELLVSEELKKTDAHHGLIILDIDNFKTVNDTNGHLFGDRVLVKFAYLLTSVFHKNDIIARIGGDEFLVFATNIQKETLLQRAKEVIAGCEEIFPPGLLGLRISPSIGIALFPDHGTSLVQLYPRADRALYQSKATGKNRATFYSTGMENISAKAEDLL
jgi:diguanylate cyclase (GGDEF)-like protein